MQDAWMVLHQVFTFQKDGEVDWTKPSFTIGAAVGVKGQIEEKLLRHA